MDEDLSPWTDDPLACWLDGPLVHRKDTQQAYATCFLVERTAAKLNEQSIGKLINQHAAESPVVDPIKRAATKTVTLVQCNIHESNIKSRLTSEPLASQMDELKRS